MISNFTLRSLIILSFVIFAMPFFNMCSIKKNGEAVERKTEIVGKFFGKNNLENTNYQNDSLKTTSPIINKNNKIVKFENSFQKFIEKQCQLDRLSVYGILYFTLVSVFFDHEIKFLIGVGTISFNILIMFFLLLFSFKDNYKKLFVLSILNLIIIFLWPIILFISKNADDISGVLYGYYLLTINAIIIVFLIYKLKIKSELKIMSKY